MTRVRPATVDETLDVIFQLAERTRDQALLELWVDATANYQPVRERARNALRAQGWAV